MLKKYKFYRSRHFNGVSAFFGDEQGLKVFFTNNTLIARERNELRYAQTRPSCTENEKRRWRC